MELALKSKVEEDIRLEKTTTALRRLSHEMQSPRLAVECSLLSLNHTLLIIRESLAK